MTVYFGVDLHKTQFTVHERTCEANQLTALDIQGLSNLKVLSCAFNQLNAGTFIKLFNDLPKRTPDDKATCTLYFEGEFQGNHDGNHTDFTSPPALKTAFDKAKNEKKWTMCKLLLENGNPKQVNIN